jgi:flavin-dependent dehydrogenase
VIGAGIAGLAAAQQMQQFGMEVVVLEARVRMLLTTGKKEGPSSALYEYCMALHAVRLKNKQFLIDYVYNFYFTHGMHDLKTIFQLAYVI